MNYTWWLNRKDADGHNVFEGGFLGLDNISVYDRSQPLPPGYSLKQADATGWMAMFSLNMTVMCQELAAAGLPYEDVAIQCYTQFMGIANCIAGHSLSLIHISNVYVADGSVLPRSARVNPALTIYAWGLRVATHLGRRERDEACLLYTSRCV